MRDVDFIVRGDEVALLTEKTKTVSLAEGIGELAMTVYANMLERGEKTDSAEKNRLETEIRFQSKVLDSLSNAYAALHSAKS